MNVRPVMIMAGGTGGHIFPALAVARELMSREIPVVWMGSPQGMEARLIPDTGIPIAWLTISGLRGKGMKSWLMAPFKLLVAMIQAFRLLRQYRPRAVLGMGGFVAGPGGAVASMLRIPLVIHEQNSVAGLTNRLLSKVAGNVLQAFPGGFASSGKVETVGNPVRPEITALPAPEERAIAQSEKLKVLVIGGSLGAVIFNKTLPRAVSMMPESERPEIFHQAGVKNIEAARSAYKEAGVEARIEPFISDMAEAYAWADLVICRSGALTVSELAAAGVGSILVPYPYAVDDHQTGNARYLSEAGAAILMAQPEFTVEHISEYLHKLTASPEVLQEMAIKARALAQPESTQRVADVCEVAGGTA
jgi:UDP-N-acetylglucosamine--N-acetylmuramyl-(pentapeptide) pyrophosphoryl-undecaprenol N-acetylglucosamine transferase